MSASESYISEKRDFSSLSPLSLIITLLINNNDKISHLSFKSQLSLKKFLTPLSESFLSFVSFEKYEGIIENSKL